jgi:hypothetical protein
MKFIMKNLWPGRRNCVEEKNPYAKLMLRVEIMEMGGILW